LPSQRVFQHQLLALSEEASEEHVQEDHLLVARRRPLITSTKLKKKPTAIPPATKMNTSKVYEVRFVGHLPLIFVNPNRAGLLTLGSWQTLTADVIHLASRLSMMPPGNVPMHLVVHLLSPSRSKAAVIWGVQGLFFCSPIPYADRPKSVPRVRKRQSREASNSSLVESQIKAPRDLQLLELVAAHPLRRLAMASWGKRTL
jgi:hypothetical protein